MIPHARKAIHVLTLFVCFLAVSAAGYDKPVLMESVRSMSMGGASVSVADDENLLFFNPAGLVNIEDSKITILNLGAKFNPDTFRCVNELTYSYNKVKDFRALPTKSVDKLINFRPLLSASPLALIYIRPNFALSLVNTEVNVEGYFARSGEESIVEISSYGDAAIMLSMGYRVFRDLSIGGTIKYLSRFNMEDNHADDLVDHKPTILIGRGLGLDTGILWKAEDWSAGFSVRDTFGTKFAWKYGMTRGEWGQLEKEFKTKIDEDVTLGFSYKPDWKLSVYPYIPEDLVFAIDIGAFRPLFRNLHLGMEARIFRWLALRAGINAGLMVGIGLNTTIWHLDFMYATHLRDEYLEKTTYNNFCFSIALKY